jgi:hypothetical protein
MLLLKWGLLSLMAIFFLIFDGGIALSDSLKSIEADDMIPTTRGLNFDKITFLVLTEPRFRERLRLRAIGQLTKAGIYNKKNEAILNSEKLGTLRLTLETRPLNEECTGKFMYKENLELWETVHPERNPSLRVHSVTWSYGLATPAVVDKVTIEQLEADLDKLIFEFIRAYKMGNPTSH